MPSTGKELVSFLGFCSYYRGFIPEFSKTTAGLNKLRNEKTLSLSPEGIKKIDELKDLFQKCHLRAYPVYLSSFDFEIKHISGAKNTAADALSRTASPAQSGDPDEPDSLLVYPDIEDVFSLEQGSDWSLKYKKDLALTQVIKYVQEGTNPSNEERRNLPVRTNQLLRWFKYLYVEDGLLHLLKPNSAGS